MKLYHGGKFDAPQDAGIPTSALVIAGLVILALVLDTVVAVLWIAERVAR